MLLNLEEVVVMVGEDEDGEADILVFSDGRVTELFHRWADTARVLTVVVSVWTLQSLRSVLHVLAEAEERAGRPLIRTTDDEGLRDLLEWLR